MRFPMICPKSHFPPSKPNDGPVKDKVCWHRTPSHLCAAIPPPDQPMPHDPMTTGLPFFPAPPWSTTHKFLRPWQRIPSPQICHPMLLIAQRQALSSSSRSNDLRDPPNYSALLQRSSSIRPSDAEKIPSGSFASDAGLQFREKLLYLELMGVDVMKALANNPSIRSVSLDSIQNIVKFLEQMGMMHKDMGKIFGMRPQILTSSIDEDLMPVFSFLTEEVRIPEKDLRTCINRCPRLLACSVKDQLRPTLYYLRRLGFLEKHSITCATTVLLASSVEKTFIPKLEYLQSLGFSYKDTVSMVVRAPGLLTFSIATNFQPKFDYLVNEIGGNLDDLKGFPQYFAFSLEKRIKPRHRFMMEYHVSLPLSRMLKTTDGEFWEILQQLHFGSGAYCM